MKPTKEKHICHSHREDDWLVHTCDVCGYKVKIREFVDWTSAKVSKDGKIEVPPQSYGERVVVNKGWTDRQGRPVVSHESTFNPLDLPIRISMSADVKIPVRAKNIFSSN